MKEDKTNIGLLLEATNVAEELEEIGIFQDKINIAKFGLAFALKNSLDDNLETFQMDAGGTRWNVGSVDNDQYLREIILSLYPGCDTPYRYIEALINNGLMKIGEIKKKEGNFKNISKYMK